MHLLKDLYSILECSPSDDQAEIKKKYRKLAQKYHPDKNPNDKYAELRFVEIKEAYEILISPKKKEIWLQERWLHQVMNKTNFEKQPLTPHLILFNILQWEKELYHSDRFRLNDFQCENKLEIFLSNEYIDRIHYFNETEITNQILIHLIRVLQWLPPSMTEKYKENIFKLVQNNPEQTIMLQELIQRKKWEKIWFLWKIPVILLFTVMICFFIIKMSH